MKIKFIFSDDSNFGGFVRKLIPKCSSVRNSFSNKTSGSKSQNPLFVNSVDITVDNFKILCFAREEVDLRISESIFIFKRRPLLNNMQSAFPLLSLRE